ncbi:MAG: A/G-specific adenine glycosylase, partial [Alphaproteobacteria bacterium]|nr:A/G-specific adenine glycosylase [Alphaproteobacteria bacterium]
MERARVRGNDIKRSLAQEEAGNKPSDRLLLWYDSCRRSMPWRAPPGKKPNPYFVWLSEQMLQQTTVTTVTPYFKKFVTRWPNLQALAEARLDEILEMWAGLGYYRRARALHEGAQRLYHDLKGSFPQEESALRQIPGLGPYSAAAIAAIAFDRRANVVDGNVERVMARLHAIKMTLPEARPKLRQKAAQMLPEARYGDYAQALMDLGATI